MTYRKITKDLMKIFSLLSVLITVCLIIVSFISWTYLTGFLLGCLCSLSFYWLNEWCFGIWLAKRKTFRLMFLISFLKFFAQMLILSLILIGVLYLNQFYNSDQKWDLSRKRIDGIFNIFLFIVGCSMMMISIIFYHIGHLIMKKNNSL